MKGKGRFRERGRRGGREDRRREVWMQSRGGSLIARLF